MLSWVALHLAVAISALDGDESSRRELDVNYSDQCKNLATKYGKKQRSGCEQERPVSDGATGGRRHDFQLPAVQFCGVLA